MRPTHLVGHVSRNHPDLILSACNNFNAHLHSIEGERLTFLDSEVTCIDCLRIISEGSERDPVTRLLPTSGFRQ